MRVYAIGHKNFSTGYGYFYALSPLGYGGGSLLFYALSNEPIVVACTTFYHINILGASIGLLLNGQFLAVRMGEFLNNVSVAEAMGDHVWQNSTYHYCH